MHANITMPLLVLVAVLAVAGLAGLALRGGAGRTAYVARRRFMSDGEREFFAALNAAVGEGYRVFGQVRMADLFDVAPGISGKARMGALNRVSAKSLDFLVCQADDLTLVAGIELDDRTHGLRKRQERDGFVDGLFASAGVPLLRFKTLRSYEVAAIRSQWEAAVIRPPITELAAEPG